MPISEVICLGWGEEAQLTIRYFRGLGGTTDEDVDG